MFQVLKEAMRLFPPAPVHFREAIKELDLGQGHIIPAGTNIFISVYALHRNPSHFPEPENLTQIGFLLRTVQAGILMLTYPLESAAECV